MIIEQQYPPGWDEARVRTVIEHYENQTEDEQYDEIEATYAEDGMTVMAVPTEKVSAIRKLLAESQRA